MISSLTKTVLAALPLCLVFGCNSEPNTTEAEVLDQYEADLEDASAEIQRAAEEAAGSIEDANADDELERLRLELEGD